MKPIVALLICVICLTKAQAQQNPAEQLAMHISHVMKDSLGLTEPQRAGIFAINMQLYLQKTSARNQFKGAPDSVRVHIQHIENKRDSLYQQVLSNIQFEAYKQKKALLLRNN